MGLVPQLLTVNIDHIAQGTSNGNNNYTSVYILADNEFSPFGWLRNRRKANFASMNNDIPTYK